MTIRRKDNRAVYVEGVERVLYPSLAAGGANLWAIANDTDGITRYYNNAIWEEVPVEKWVRAPLTLTAQNTLRVYHDNGDRHTNLILPSTFRFVQDGLNIFVEERVA